mgnify:CR=1 FL=1
MELGNLRADHIVTGVQTYNGNGAVRFGIKISKAESNPEKRVTYNL